MNISLDHKEDLRRLGIALIAALVLELVFSLMIVPRFAAQLKPFYGIGPADNYLTLAKNIDAGHGYRFTPDTSPTMMREPGYPYFLAGLLAVFDNDHEGAVVANILFTALTALLVATLARRASPLRGLAFVAPILYMVHPGVILSELRGGIESIFTLLIMGFLVLLLDALRSDKAMAYVRAGLALGITSLVRSSALLFPSFIVLVGLLGGAGWRSLPRFAAKAVLVFACALIALSPWIIRNELLVGKFVPTASVQGVAMQVGEYICVHSGEKDRDILDLDAATIRNQLAAHDGYRFQGDYYQFFYDPRDELTFSSALGRQVVQDYAHSPGLFVKCASQHLFDFWFAGKSPGVTLVNLCTQLPYLLLAIAGIVLEFRRIDRLTLILASLFVAYSLAVYVPMHAQARYSIPLVPLLAVFAAMPLCRWQAARAARASQAAAVPAVE
jgi:4-amino-4-deoxy-L-arabinose transferase-like glycosyltransferase